jgi:hypothetical protein
MALTVTSLSNDMNSTTEFFQLATDGVALTGTVQTIVGASGGMGFVPRYIALVNLATGALVEWYAGLANGGKISTAANGTATPSATAGFTMTTGGGGTLTIDNSCFAVSTSYTLVVQR